MSKRVILIFLFITFRISYGYAQNTNSSGDNEVNIFTNGDNHLTRVTFKRENSAIQGNIYLFPKWIESGKLLTKTEKKYTLLNLNYNVLSDNFEFKISKDSIFRLDSDYIQQINISGAIFRKYNVKVLKNHFVEVLFENYNVLLLKKYDIRILRGSLDPLNGEITPDKYHIYSEFYFLQDNIPTKITLNKKDVISLFREKSHLVRNYAKKNGLSYKKEKDIINILQFGISL